MSGARETDVTPEEARHLADRLREEGFDRLGEWVDREADRREENPEEYGLPAESVGQSTGQPASRDRPKRDVDESPDADELLEAVDRGELDAEDALEQLADQDAPN